MKKYFPYIFAILLFITLSLIQFKPLFQGKIVKQYDITQYNGMSKEIKDFREKEHKEPLWTNSLFGGMPSYQISTAYPGNWLKYFDRFFHAFLPGVSGIMFMYFAGFFILLLCLEINPWLALLGSLAFGFSSYFYIIIEVGHNSKASAVGYLSPVIGGVILLMRKKNWLGLTITSIFLALELNANHLQVTYYGLLLILLILAAYFIESVKKKEIRPYFSGVMLFVLSMVIAVLPNSGNLLCTYEYSKHTTRGKTELTIDATGKSNQDKVTSGLDKDYAVQYSYGISESLSFLIPNYKGGGSADQISNNRDAMKKIEDPQMRQLVGQFSAYFGPQEYTAGPTYVGAIIILLAFLGLLIIDHTIKWPLIIACALAIMLAWGKYFMPLSSIFLDFLPGYNKFRAVSIINVIAEITIPLIAILALDKIIKNYQNNITLFRKTYKLKQLILFSLIVVGGFCLLSVLFPDLFNTFTKEGEYQDLQNTFKQSGYTDDTLQQIFPQFIDALEVARKKIFVDDALRSLLFILIAASILYLYVIEKIKPVFVIGCIGLLFILDGWPVVWRYLNYNDFVSKTQFESVPITEADAEILADKDLNYRVANLTTNPFGDGVTSYYHKSIGGYHGAKLKKYDELIQFHLFKELNYFSNNIGHIDSDSTQKSILSGIQVLNMLNTKYFILPAREKPVVFKNTSCNGNAWFVKTIKTVPNPDAEILALGNIDLKTNCIIQEKNKGANIQSNYPDKGTIKLIAYKANQLVYESNTTNTQFAVFSEIYYPNGWKASIDGAPQDHYAVNYLLRGMLIPAGKHEVVFSFEPEVYYFGNSVAMVGSSALCLLILTGVYLGYRRREFEI